MNRVIFYPTPWSKRIAANEASLQLGLPFAPHGIAAVSNIAGHAGMAADGNTMAPATAVARRRLQLKLDPCDARRAVIVGSMREVCETLDRLSAAEGAAPGP